MQRSEARRSFGSGAPLGRGPQFYSDSRTARSDNTPYEDGKLAEISSGTDGSLEVPAGRFSGLLMIREGDRAGAWKERKYYARGVGLVSENGELNLTEYERAAR